MVEVVVEMGGGWVAIKSVGITRWSNYLLIRKLKM